MKKLLLTLAFMAFGLCYAFENTQAQFPQAQFHSVSSYKQVTNYQPNITPVGATRVDGQAYSPRPRREGSNVNPGGDSGDPNVTPIGDCPIELLITFAIICVVVIKIRSNKCKLADSTSTNG